MNLRTAIATIHRDRFWWRTVLIGGALSCTVIGYPWVAGLVMESLENTRNGVPTPLPRWHDWSTRYLIGLFAILIDILFFALPVFGIGLLLACGGGALAIAGAGWLMWMAPAGLVVLLVYELAVFASGVAPIGRTMFADAGQLEDVLSTKPLRMALRPATRAVYMRARLQSLPAYLPALLLLLAAWLVSWPINLLVIWLALSALVYAHLVVVQLYVIADREVRRF
jgi:hypothetical protein